MTRKHLRSLALYLLLVSILLMLLAPTVMDAVNLQSRKTKSQQDHSRLTTSLLRGKIPQETRKFLDAILQVESCSAVVNNSNVVGNYQGEV